MISVLSPCLCFIDVEGRILDPVYTGSDIDRIQEYPESFGSDPFISLRLQGIGSSTVCVYTVSDPVVNPQDLPMC